MTITLGPPTGPEPGGGGNMPRPNPNTLPPPTYPPDGPKKIGGYECGWLGGRAGWRGALTMRWGADPAKPVWNCPHQHPTSLEAVACAEAEARSRTRAPVKLSECFAALTDELERNRNG